MGPNNYDYSLDEENELEEYRREEWTRLEEASRKCSVIIDRYRSLKKLNATDHNYRKTPTEANDIGIANALLLRGKLKTVMLLQVREGEVPELEPRAHVDIPVLQEDIIRDLQAAKTKAEKDEECLKRISMALGHFYEITKQFDQARAVYEEALEGGGEEEVSALLEHIEQQLLLAKSSSETKAEQFMNEAKAPVIKSFFEQHGEEGRISSSKVPQLVEALGTFPPLRAVERNELLRQLGTPHSGDVHVDAFCGWIYGKEEKEET